jgi:hypothetical protein
LDLIVEEPRAIESRKCLHIGENRDGIKHDCRPPGELGLDLIETKERRITGPCQ